MARRARDPLDGLAQIPAGSLDPAANPFAAREGAVPPVFGGRDRVLSAARADLERLRAGRPAARRALEGLRGTGKTALMARMRGAAREVGVATAHLEADPGPGVVAMAVVELRATVEQLLGRGQRATRRLGTLRSLKVGPGGVELSWAGPEDHNLLEALILDAARVAQARGSALLITLDEAHEAEATLLKPVVRALHRAGQDGLPAAAWFAGLPGTLQRLIAHGQTYAERIALFELVMLDMDAVAEAIAGPFADHGVAMDDGVIARVHRECEGYPFFVQAWGEALWTACADGRRVTMKDAARAASGAASRADDLMQIRWQRLSRRARPYVRAMAALGGEGPWRTADVAGHMQRTAKSVSPARADTIASGVAAPVDRGLIGLTIPGFAAWVRRHQP